MAGKEKNSETSLRNPLAALASVHEDMAKGEPNDLDRAHRRKVARKLRELARQEPKPKG